MKKIFFTCLVAIAGVAGITGFATQTYGQTALTAMQLENIEALTASEESTRVEYRCYNTITTKKYSTVRYCGTCEYVQDSTYSWVSSEGSCEK